jgi:hypothetical protein
MRYWLLFFLATSLFGRLNPFIPTMNIENITNNRPEDIGYFTESNLYLPSSSRILKKVTLTHQNIDGSIEEVSKNIDKKIDWHYAVSISQPHDDGSDRTYSYLFKKVHLKNIPFIKINAAKNAVLLDTDDTILRSFMLTKPYRIVIDFKADERFRAKSKQIANSYFKKVVIGNHDGYYRTVLYLDSYYDFKLDKKKKGYLIELKQ